MTDKDFTEKNLEQACIKAATLLKIRTMVARVKIRGQDTLTQLVRPDMRPHTWVFLRQNDEDPPAICLGIVFHVWATNKYNMVKFVAHNPTGQEIVTRGRLVALDNGSTGLIVDKRWAWNSLLKRFKGLSAGDL